MYKVSLSPPEGGEIFQAVGWEEGSFEVHFSFFVVDLSLFEDDLMPFEVYLSFFDIILAFLRFISAFWGQNNIKNELGTIKLLRKQIFIKIRQLLKNHYLSGDFKHFWG